MIGYDSTNRNASSIRFKEAFNPPNPLRQGGAGAYRKLSYLIKEVIFLIVKAGGKLAYDNYITYRLSFSQLYEFGLPSPANCLREGGTVVHRQLNPFIRKKVLLMEKTCKDFVNYDDQGSSLAASQYQDFRLHRLVFPLRQGGAGAYRKLSYLIEEVIFLIVKASGKLAYNDYRTYRISFFQSDGFGLPSPANCLREGGTRVHRQLNPFIRKKVLLMEKACKGFVYDNDQGCHLSVSQYQGFGLHNLCSPLEKGARGIDYILSGLYQNAKNEIFQYQ